ncbi:accessory Sec system glycosyltransferase Asp1, partial [Streptococcus agalactiae]
SRIPPFDTRLRLGQSQNIEELIAYLLVDDLSQTYLSEVLDQLLAKMEVNPSLELKIVSYKNDYDMTSLKEQVKDKILSSKNPDYFFTSLSLEDENHFKEEQ